MIGSKPLNLNIGFRCISHGISAENPCGLDFDGLCWLEFEI